MKKEYVNKTQKMRLWHPDPAHLRRLILLSPFPLYESSLGLTQQAGPLRSFCCSGFRNIIRFFCLLALPVFSSFQFFLLLFFTDLSFPIVVFFWFFLFFNFMFLFLNHRIQKMVNTFKKCS